MAAEFFGMVLIKRGDLYPLPLNVGNLETKRIRTVNMMVCHFQGWSERLVSLIKLPLGEASFHVRCLTTLKPSGQKSYVQVFQPTE